MPALVPLSHPPMFADGDYDLQAGVALAFLNRTIAFAIASGDLPHSFITKTSIVEPQLGARISLQLAFELDVVRLFARASHDRQIGIHLEFSGSVLSRFELDAWTFNGPAGAYTDPALDESFVCPFSGVLEATAEVAITRVGDTQMVAIRFGQLLRSDVIHVGDLEFGPNANEVIRQVLERVGVVRLRTSFSFPALIGLAGSLPAPARELFGTPSGQFGTTDLKVVGGRDAATPDEIHLLLEADQNVGHQNYARVDAFTDGTFDVGLSVGYRWARQVLQDLWAGGAIPTKFDDHGRPDTGGKVQLRRIDFTFMDGSLQVHARLAREVVGLPLELNATLEIAPRFSGDLLFVDLIASDIDIQLGWARAAGLATVFFVVRDVIVRLLLMAVDEVLAVWSLPILQKFLDGHGIDVRHRFSLPGTPLQVDLLPNTIAFDTETVLLGCRIDLSK